MQEKSSENRIILASKSPRRSLLLGLIGVQFQLFTPEYEEIILGTALETAKHNSIAKAKFTHDNFKNRYILTADTVIEFDGKIIGKPANLIDAKNTLLNFSGITHKVITAVTIVNPKNNIFTLIESTIVKFKQINNTTVDKYLRKVSPFDKAGSYGIQDFGWMLIDSIEGSIDNVMGLPLSKVIQLLSLASYTSNE